MVGKGTIFFTFEFDVLVYILVQRLVIFIYFGIVLYYVAFGCVEWGVDGDDAALIASMFDLLFLRLAEVR